MTERQTVAGKYPTPRLSGLARAKKLDFFFSRIPKEARVLDVGCADGWAERWARERGWTNLVGLDLLGPADVVSDVRDWRAAGLDKHSFDAILAFEVVEHGDITPALHDLLKPSGRLMATTPVPQMDWACQLGELAGLLQRRTSPHTHLVDLRHVPSFEAVEHHVRGFISQWAVLRPI